MASKPVLALIVASPSSLQNGLMALLTTISQISAVMVAEEASLALRMVRDHHPALLLLDVNLPESQTLLKQLKTDWPKTRCILLVDSVEQKEGVIDADAVLIKGFPAEKLIGTVEQLLSQREIDSPIKSNSTDEPLAKGGTKK
ncbi:MAG: response regulator [Anaerolineales bacterium]|nr:response regulator [Anaerolineales bacterium]